MALPSGYRELLYIKSTGTQYIDTGVKPNQNTVLKMDVAFLGTAGNNIAGVRNTASDTTNRFGIITFGSASKIGAFFQSSSIQAISFDNSRHEYELSKSGLYVDGTLYGSSNSGSFTCTYPIVLFGWNNGSGGVSATANSVYSCKIYDGSTLIRDFVPAKRTSDSVVGLYDLQNDVFYTNAGTGEFVGVITTGPVDGSGVSIVQATSYGIRAGKTLVDGTVYDIYNGRTLVGGTGYNIAFGIPLSTLPEGTIVYLNENGSPVEFYIAKHDYESGLNGSGRTLLARKNGISGRVWNSSEVNTYASCTLNTWLNGTYKAIFDADIQAEISTTKFYYTPGNGNYKVGTLSKSIFIPSVTELGKSDNYANKEGSTLPIASTLRQLYVDGTRVDQWTRSPYTTVNTTNALYLKTNNYINYGSVTYSKAVRPIFTLPCETLVNPSDYTIIG